MWRSPAARVNSCKSSLSLLKLFEGSCHDHESRMTKVIVVGRIECNSKLKREEEGILKSTIQI